jgi:hypothetical protein
MKRGEYKLADQVGEKGYFGKVALEIEMDDGSGAVSIDFDAANARDWQTGARFGIDYVLEHIPKKKLFPKGARIHVDSIQGHAVDTTSAVIAFAAANALLRALGLDAVPSKTKRPNFDREKGLFVFPQ